MGQLHELNRASLLVGRNTDSDLPLADEGVSRRHLRIERLPNEFRCSDLGSTNGTYVNGERIEVCALKDGDRIQLGVTTTFKFVEDDLEGQLWKHLYESTIRDPLTLMHNKRFFDEELTRAFSHAERHDCRLSLLMIDIDHFKSFNDEHGHSTGDAVLKRVAIEIARSVRREDVACRIGGEEFAVIARDTRSDQAEVLAERLRSRIEELEWPGEARNLQVRVSIGISALEAASQSFCAELTKTADEALYQAKKAGRNRVRAISI